MASIAEISVSRFARLFGTPDCPALLDVRVDEDFDDDPRLIPGARRHPFDDMVGWMRAHPSPKVVVYCQKGLKISQGAAAILRSYGICAETLQGGHLAWKDQGYPLVPVHKIPTLTEGSSLWVTRHRPKVDRVACPWLIKRFVDPKARFLFVSPSQVELVAEKFSATPFDMEGAFWGHRGAQCTFDTMVDEFALHTPAIDRLALIVRAADTNAHQLAPQAAGLLATCLGLSRMHKDDQAQLSAAMPLFDALYRWARDASDEGHEQ